MTQVSLEDESSVIVSVFFLSLALVLGAGLGRLVDDKDSSAREAKLVEDEDPIAVQMLPQEVPKQEAQIEPPGESVPEPPTESAVPEEIVATLERKPPDTSELADGISKQSLVLSVPNNAATLERFLTGAGACLVQRSPSSSIQFYRLVNGEVHAGPRCNGIARGLPRMSFLAGGGWGVVVPATLVNQARTRGNECMASGRPPYLTCKVRSET